MLCLDLDSQSSFKGWWESRETETRAMLECGPAPNALRDTPEAAKAQFDLCIINTPLPAPDNPIHLAPGARLEVALRRDYAGMREMIMGDAPSFDDVMSAIAELEAEINAT